MMSENICQLIDGQAVYLAFDYDHATQHPESQHSYLRFLKHPPEGDDICPNGQKYQVAVSPKGATAFRMDSILSLFCIMRGFPVGAWVDQCVGKLLQGQH